MINYQLTYKNIKRINLRVNKNGVMVSAPFFTSKAKIDTFVASKHDWILKQLSYHEKHTQIQKVDYNYDLFIFNETYQIVFKNEIINPILRDNKLFINNHKKEHYKSIINRFLKDLLLETISEIKVEFDDILKFHQKDLPMIIVKDLKSKWGICYPKENKIIINLQLIHYSKKALKYVLLHEYLHLIVPNHSSQFYQLVNQYCPNYREILRELNR